MKSRLVVALAALLGAILAITANAAEEPAIGKVFFAQHHVQEPDNPLFKLVGDLNALIKVQIYSETKERSPDVTATLALGDQTKKLTLKGPRRLPEPYRGEPALMPHSYKDSFTAVIPKEWVRPGLKVTVELSRKGETIGEPRVIDVNVGAPTKALMTVFDVYYFGLDKRADYPRGWEKQLAARLPFSELKIQRVKDLRFNTLVMPPRGESPAIRCSSPEEYKERTGMNYDGEQGIALRWTSALKAAAGRNGRATLYYTSIVGVHAGGQSSGLLSVGSMRRYGVMLHELGHSFGLPHWQGRERYPYKGNMFGIETTNGKDGPHVGPIWAFDPIDLVFTPPTVQENGRGGTPGTWKRDPMAGGGMGDSEKPYLYRHFSDFSFNQMQNSIERRMIFRDDKTGKYLCWDQESGSYVHEADPDGWKLPLGPDQDVISILASVSGPTPEANFIYDPIGPYKAGLIHLFDAEAADDRTNSQQYGFSEETCNVCLRVTQGGKTTTYLVPVKISADDDPIDGQSFHVTAINLPADAGKVTAVDLLLVPGVMKRGLAGESKVLYSWPEK